MLGSSWVRGSGSGMRFCQLKRRAFIALLGGAAAAWPLTARAQQPANMRTIGYLGPSTPVLESQRVAAFVHRLHELGWIENRTIAIEYRWAEGRSERFSEIAAEFVRLNVDVIVTWSSPTVIAVKQATSVIPIVFAAAGDPVSAGLVASSPSLQASGSGCCARLFPLSAVWRSWVLLTIPPSRWKWAMRRQQPAR